MKRIQVYDTTLRDGCQGEEVALTVEAKLAITERVRRHDAEGGVRAVFLRE